MTTILCLLPSQWLHDPDKLHEMVQRAEREQRRELRQRHLIRALFQSLTGQKLKAGWGADLCQRVMFDNVTPEAHSTASIEQPYDIGHVTRLLEHIKPDIVVALSPTATAAMQHESIRKIWNGELLTGPHPAARAAGTADAIKDIGADLTRRLT